MISWGKRTNAFTRFCVMPVLLAFSRLFKGRRSPAVALSLGWQERDFSHRFCRSFPLLSSFLSSLQPRNYNSELVSVRAWRITFCQNAPWWQPGPRCPWCWNHSASHRVFLFFTRKWPFFPSREYIHFKLSVTINFTHRRDSTINVLKVNKWEQSI